MAPPKRHEGPGLVDLQVNGYKGFDFNAPSERWDKDLLLEARDALRKRGVAAVFPALITDDLEQTFARIRKYAAWVEADPELADMFPGLHLEGPFISPEDGPRGVHPAAYCRTPSDVPDFLDLAMDAGRGKVGLLTLAPELPGSLELIEKAFERGICVGIGHTRADGATLLDAVEAGARMSTHLGNGSDSLLPRLDNYVQVQLAHDRLQASFIADGHHIPFHTLKNFIRAKTVERTILVTDAMAAADAGCGRYKLGRETVMVSGDLKVSLPDGLRLAGSALTLDKAVINVSENCGVPFDEAWRMASTYPAFTVGLPEPEKVKVEISEKGFTSIP